MMERPGQSGFSLPYRMAEKGKIEDSANGKIYTIKYGFYYVLKFQKFLFIQSFYS